MRGGPAAAGMAARFRAYAVETAGEPAGAARHGSGERPALISLTINMKCSPMPQLSLSQRVEPHWLRLLVRDRHDGLPQQGVYSS